MINLYDCQKELDYIINTVKNIFDIDSAVFDIESNLVISTESYALKKGKTVHSPSIREAIIKGTVTVNEPGRMPSCIGCRFKDHCPSTIEILKIIRTSAESLGVLTFTSFSKDVHDKIISNIEFYINLAEYFSNIMAMMIMQKYTNLYSVVSKASLTTSLDMLDDGLITTDTDGNIDVVNAAAVKFFSSCGMYTKSINQLFPPNIVSIILHGHTISDYKVKINGLLVKVFSSPIKNHDVIIGTAIRICHGKFPYLEPASRNSEPLYSLDNIKGKSEHVKSIKSSVSKIANSPSTVFISGETGTGKGLLAKTLHFESNRRNKPFIMIDCASIPETLFESELFGYEFGAFTGARKEGKPGKFELANEGTLFLDEISEIPLNIQAKLLRVIQESSFERIGGTTPINIDVRIIAASNRNLEEMMSEKKFRSDLFYRLNVIPIELIPLHERSEDVTILANDFLEYFNKKLNRQILGFDNEVFDIFNTSSWPGNIRQLENVIEYCVNMTDNEVITTNDLPQDFMRIFKKNHSVHSSKLKDSAQNIIVETINKYGWDVKGKTAAAKELGIGLRTLYRKLNE